MVVVVEILEDRTEELTGDAVLVTEIATVVEEILSAGGVRARIISTLNVRIDFVKRVVSRVMMHGTAIVRITGD